MNHGIGVRGVGWMIVAAAAVVGPALFAPRTAAAQGQSTVALAKPFLRFIGTEDYTTSAGAWTRYRLVVDNEYEFPDAMFAPAPELPPCGKNPNSSRTWVDILGYNGARIYGFCALGASSGLRNIWFAMERGAPPPDTVYIELEDRKTNQKSMSNLVEPGRSAKPLSEK